MLKHEVQQKALSGRQLHQHHGQLYTLNQLFCVSIVLLSHIGYLLLKKT